MNLLRFAVSNRENAKKLEFHEIIESRISRILLDSTEKSFLWRDSLRYLFFFVFFHFPFASSRFKNWEGEPPGEPLRLCGSAGSSPSQARNMNYPVLSFFLRKGEWLA